MSIQSISNNWYRKRENWKNKRKGNVKLNATLVRLEFLLNKVMMHFQ